MSRTLQILIIITGASLLISFVADRRKTLEGLKKGAMMFLKILPTVLAVIIVVSLLLYIIPEEKIAVWFGEGSGIGGYMAAAATGSISLIQGFIAYPMAGVLVQAGVGYPVIAIFITTLLMVGMITMPVEAQYLGWRVALIRNSLAFIFALLVGMLMGLLWNLF